MAQSSVLGGGGREQAEELEKWGQVPGVCDDLPFGTRVALEGGRMLPSSNGGAKAVSGGRERGLGGEGAAVTDRLASRAEAVVMPNGAGGEGGGGPRALLAFSFYQGASPLDPLPDAPLCSSSAETLGFGNFVLVTRQIFLRALVPPPPPPDCLPHWGGGRGGLCCRPCYAPSLRWSFYRPPFGGGGRAHLSGREGTGQGPFPPPCKPHDPPMVTNKRPPPPPAPEHVKECSLMGPWGLYLPCRARGSAQWSGHEVVAAAAESRNIKRVHNTCAK